MMEELAPEQNFQNLEASHMSFMKRPKYTEKDGDFFGNTAAPAPVAPVNQPEEAKEQSFMQSNIFNIDDVLINNTTAPKKVEDSKSSFFGLNVMLGQNWSHDNSSNNHHLI